MAHATPSHEGRRVPLSEDLPWVCTPSVRDESQPEPEPEPEPHVGNVSSAGCPAPAGEDLAGRGGWLSTLEGALEYPCKMCGRTVKLGEEVWPSTGGAWVHRACQQSAGLSLVPPLCKYWVRLGRCSYGAECRYRHDGSEEELRAARQRPRLCQGGGKSGRAAVRNSCKEAVFRRWLLDTFGRELLRGGEGGGGAGSEGGGSPTRYIIDVAGGKGALSYELENLNDLRACVVDPRPLSLGRYRKRQRYAMWSRSPVFAKYIDVADYATRPGRSPRQLRVFLDEALVQAVAKGPAAAAAYDWAAARARGSSVAWGVHGLQPVGRGGRSDADSEEDSTNVDGGLLGDPALLFRREDRELGRYSEFDGRGVPTSVDGVPVSKNARKKFEKRYATALRKWEHRKTLGAAASGSASSPATAASQIRTAAANSSTAASAAAELEPGSEITDRAEAFAALRTATVVVGLHPDQATEPAVDLALRCGHSFAVVPCCVYSADFRSRRLDGKPVTNYEQLVRYLRAKSDKIKTATLDFEGQNTVLYAFGARDGGQ